LCFILNFFQIDNNQRILMTLTRTHKAPGWKQPSHVAPFYGDQGKTCSSTSPGRGRTPFTGLCRRISDRLRQTAKMLNRRGTYVRARLTRLRWRKRVKGLRGLSALVSKTDISIICNLTGEQVHKVSCRGSIPSPTESAP
jgi:hypothetical protein